MAKFKILFINHASRMGGAERVLFDLLENLNRDQFEPILICPPGALAEQAKEISVKCIELEGLHQLETTRTNLKPTDLFSVFRIISQINQSIRKIKPDLIYSNSVKAHIFVNYKKRKVKTLIRLHDFPSSFEGVSAKLLNRALVNADFVSCVSKSVADDVRAFIQDNDQNKLVVNYNGVHMRRDSEAKVGSANPKIVIAGWLFAWKGFDLFVDAMEEIAEECPEWEFLIAGGVAEDTQESVTYSRTLQSKISQSKFKDRFILHGGYKSLEEILNTGENCIFVQPSSRPDPLPTVILEAAQFKVPIIASDLGGSKEIIQNEISGFLISPDKDEIVDAVRKLVNDNQLRTDFGEAIYQTVSEDFSINSYKEDMEALLLKAMNN